MRAAVWNFIAALCARPRIFAWLVRCSLRTPYYHLGGYMHRWWLMPRWALRMDNGVLMPKPWVPFAIRIHHILREDRDPYLHDHPWSWRTILLSGWYVEQDVFGHKHLRLAGSTRCANAETLHRIDEVPDNGVWTLFITGRKRNKWGFVIGDPARKIYHRDYNSANGRTSPAKDAA